MKKLAIASLIVSLGALALAITTYLQADARAEAALRQREKAWVDRLKPSVQRLYQDFAIKDRPDPQTLDELLGPLVELIDGVETKK